MAVAVDATSSGSGSAGTTLTISHVVGSGSGRMLVVSIQSAAVVGGDISDVKYGGVALTKAQQNMYSTTAIFYTQIWYLASPATGTANVVITKGNTDICAAECISLTGASATIGGVNGVDTGGGDPATVTVTVSGTSGMVIDSMCSGSEIYTVGAGQTQIAQIADFGGSIRDGMASYEAHSGSNVTMSWTRNAGDPGWCISAMEVKVGASTTTLTLSDVPSIIERLTRLWTAPRSQSESVLLQGESTTRAWTAVRNGQSEFMSISETLTSIKGRVLDILNSVGITDSVSRVVSWTRSLAEVTVIAEIVSALRTLYSVTITETIVIVERVSRVWTLARTYVDFPSIIEYVRTPLNWLKRTLPTTTWTKRTKP